MHFIWNQESDPFTSRRRRSNADHVPRQQNILDRLPWLGAVMDFTRPYLPSLNFITLHYLYFIVVSLVSSVIFYCSSNPRWSISYTDSLFLVVSAMTEAGLNTVNLSQMTTWQQVMLWLLIIMGSSIWVSIWTILARKHSFEKRFQDLVQKAQHRQYLALDGKRTLTKDLSIMKSLRSERRDNTTMMEVSRKQHSAAAIGGTASLGQRPVISTPVVVQKYPQILAPDLSQQSAWMPAPARGGRITSAGEASPLEVTNSNAADHVGRLDASPRLGPSSGAMQSHEQAPVYRHVHRQEEAASEICGDFPPNQDFLNSQHVGGNAQFHNLSSEEREVMGGVEYRALKVLSVIVPLYFFSWQVLGCVALGAWINNNLPQPALDNGVSPWWNGVFNGVSAFNNSGMSVLDANMIPYGSSYFVLVVMGSMILAGNTAFPIFLRFWLWSLSHLLGRFTHHDAILDLKQTIHYILKYPRRVYTNLFPARATWWLLLMLFVLNGTDWAAYEVLNIGNPALASTSVNTRVANGLFQAIAVRSGGFYIVSIPTLYIGLQVLYVIMMYISVYPVVMTMRHSNVYEEQSLGIYDQDSNGQYDKIPFCDKVPHTSTPEHKSSGVGRALRRTLAPWEGVGAAKQPEAGESRISFVNHQIRSQLSHDLWWLVLAVLLITIIETHHFLEDPVDWSVFNIVFEVVSAYGCVGISVGVPNAAYSFSGAWYTGSKLVLCLVMLRGRHRGLPVALDRAVRLPGDDLDREKEEEDHRIRRSISHGRRVSI